MHQKKSKKAQRRAHWIAENGPCVRCGSTEKLEVDHIDPNYKVTHRIWDWSESRRAIELIKCQVLCNDCHYKKSAKENGWNPIRGAHGMTRYRAGCRCDVCKKSKAKWRTGYLARKKASKKAL